MDRNVVHGVDEFGCVDFGAQSLRTGRMNGNTEKTIAMICLGIGLLCVVVLAAMAAGCL